MFVKVPVSCQHVAAEYRLDKKIIALHGEIVDGAMRYYATHFPHGCGKEYDTPRKAIEGLLQDNGCFKIVIHSDTIDNLDGA